MQDLKVKNSYQWKKVVACTKADENIELKEKYV